MFNVIRILACVTPISIGLFLLQPMNNGKTSFKCSTPGTDRVLLQRQGTVLYENFMKLQRDRTCSLGRSVFTTLKGITAKTAKPWASFPAR